MKNTMKKLKFRNKIRFHLSKVDGKWKIRNVLWQSLQEK